jgi:hypothetical protein
MNTPFPQKNTKNHKTNAAAHKPRNLFVKKQTNNTVISA